jgi:ABC-type antimicrobial peptide transport system permease subunit
VSMFVICSLAALIPAYLAARMDPVKALRAE